MTISRHGCLLPFPLVRTAVSPLGVVIRLRVSALAHGCFAVRHVAPRFFFVVVTPTDGTLTTTAFIPQAVLTWKTRRAEGVSLWMYSIFVTGVALWLAYGCLSNAWPVILANAMTLLLALFILIMKLVYR